MKPEITAQGTTPEVWLRGPVAGVPSLLQPVAHALLQANEEVTRLMSDFDDRHLWLRPAGVASAGFHLQHLSGVIDRLTTYARGEGLNAAQRTALRAEGVSDGSSSRALTNTFAERVRDTVAWLATIDESVLTESCAVGRDALPSTVIGLLVHAAEHTMRHVGQLSVTARTVRTWQAPDA